LKRTPKRYQGPVLWLGYFSPPRGASSNVIRYVLSYFPAKRYRKGSRCGPFEV